MTYDPQIHHRQSIRLNGYDYSQAGAYFVTIVAYNREPLFGEIVQDDLKISRLGWIVQQAWFDLPRHYPYVVLDEFCIMPNHVYGIIVLTGEGRGGSFPARVSLPDTNHSGPYTLPDQAQTRPYEKTRHGLSEIVRALKSFSARRINIIRQTTGMPVWQRNYYERVIRDERELDRVRQYILNNPHRWADDKENLPMGKKI